MRPTPRAAALFAGGVILALLPSVAGEGLWVVWASYLAASVALVAFDISRAPRPKDLEAHFEIPSLVYIGDRDQLTVSGRFVGRRTAPALQVLADLTGHFVPLRNGAVVSADGSDTGDIPLVPQRRGTGRLERMWLRWRGPLGLITRQRCDALDREIRIVPNIRAVQSAALRFFSNKDFLSGIKVESYLGDGSEFESLREYVPGFDIRSIDWKASARHDQLMCREFRAERNHHIVLAVDTGHLMGETLNGLTKLDHAVNSALLISWFSLRNGDLVGLFGFDDQVRTFEEPRGGMHHFQRIQAASAGLEYGTSETNFTLGLAELATRLRRRSLVILLTDFVDTITAELMLENVSRLVRHHLVLFVTLRDTRLDDLATSRPHDSIDVARSLVASSFQRERELVLNQLRRLGVQVLDAAPSDISSGLINAYLDIKRRGMIA